MMRLVCGVATNDANYTTKIRDITYSGGKKIGQKLIWLCPFYSRWRGIISRCYDKRVQEKHPSYRNCSVCEEWLTFSNFKCWMEKYMNGLVRIYTFGNEPKEVRL